MISCQPRYEPELHLPFQKNSEYPPISCQPRYKPEFHFPKYQNIQWFPVKCQTRYKPEFHFPFPKYQNIHRYPVSPDINQNIIFLLQNIRISCQPRFEPKFKLTQYFCFLFPFCLFLFILHVFVWFFTVDVLIIWQLLLISRGENLLVWLWWIVKVLSNFWNLSFPLVGNYNHHLDQPHFFPDANNDGIKVMMLIKLLVVDLLHVFLRGA